MQQHIRAASFDAVEPRVFHTQRAPRCNCAAALKRSLLASDCPPMTRDRVRAPRGRRAREYIHTSRVPSFSLPVARLDPKTDANRCRVALKLDDPAWLSSATRPRSALSKLTEEQDVALEWVVAAPESAVAVQAPERRLCRQLACRHLGRSLGRARLRAAPSLVPA